MSTVYLAVQKSVDRYVALKIMSPHLVHDNTSTMRFLSEARIAARFRHPNIISILDVNTSNGVPYIAMEYVPGGALDTERIKSMSTTEKLSAMVQIADALAFLHGQNFIHRDIKPANILFRENNTAVLTDFGIASDQSVNSQMTLTGYIIGTPHYMSPEQAKGDKLDSRADLYSLGVMMFRVLTGELPFTADNPISICNMHINTPVPDLPEEHARFDHLIKKTMAKEPDDRYQTANEFIDELISATGSETARLLRRSMGGVVLQAIKGEDEEDIDSVIRAQFTPASLQTNIQPSFSTMSLIREKTRFLMGINYQAKVLSIRQRFKRFLLMLLHFLPESVQSRIRNFFDQQPKLALGGFTALFVLFVILVFGLAGGGAEEAGPPIVIDTVEIERDPVPGLLTQGEEALRIGILTHKEKANAVYFFKSVLELDPENEDAQNGLDAVAERLFRLAGLAMDNGNLATARILLDDARILGFEDGGVLASLNQRHLVLSSGIVGSSNENSGSAGTEAEQNVEIPEAKPATLLSSYDASSTGTEQEHNDIRESFPSQSDEISTLLSLGQEYLSENKLTRPANENAVSEFNKVLALDPDNALAVTGLNQVGERYLQLARGQINERRWKKAEDYWWLSDEYAPDLSGAMDVWQQLDDHNASIQSDIQPSPPPVAVASQSTSNIPPSGIAEYRLPQLNLTGNETADSLYRQAESAWTSNQKMLAYSVYKEVLNKDPDHNRAGRRLEDGAGSYIARAGRDVGKGALISAYENLSIALALDPSHSKLEHTRRNYLTARDRFISALTSGNSPQNLVNNLQIISLLEDAEFNHRRFSENNANRAAAEISKNKYHAVLSFQAENQAARSGLSILATELIAASTLAFDQARNDDALWYFEIAREIDPNNPNLSSLEDRLN